MKRIIILIVLSLGLASPGFAYTHEYFVSLDAEYTIPDCPVHGAHQLTLSGTAFVHLRGNRSLLFVGNLYKCDCGSYLICQGRPDLGEAIGRYIGRWREDFTGSWPIHEPCFQPRPWQSLTCTHVDLCNVRHGDSHTLGACRFLSPHP